MTATRYPAATWRPLSDVQTEPLITPRVLVFHTMQGFLRGTDGMFRRQGYTGTESHFGIGGPWDDGLDGAVWQWQGIDRQADAQAAGNGVATSIETSDGGDPSRPWSPAQLDALVDLTVWWCRETGNPCALVDGPTGRGLGYHAQHRAWNPNGHACPGIVRTAQLIHHVIPRARKQLTAPAPAPPTPVPPSLPTEETDMALTQDQLEQIAAAVWAAGFGPSDGRETAGKRLADLDARVEQLVAGVTRLQAQADALSEQLASIGTVLARVAPTS